MPHPFHKARPSSPSLMTSASLSFPNWGPPSKTPWDIIQLFHWRGTPVTRQRHLWYQCCRNTHAEAFNCCISLEFSLVSYSDKLYMLKAHCSAVRTDTRVLILFLCFFFWLGSWDASENLLIYNFQPAVRHQKVKKRATSHPTLQVFPSKNEHLKLTWISSGGRRWMQFYLSQTLIWVYTD